MITKALDGRPWLGFAGWQWPLANLLVLLGLSLVLLCATSWALSMGRIEVSWWDTLLTLVGWQDSATEDAHWAIFEVRLPRLVMAMMAGAAIALTGAMMQSLAQNPLADPGLLGLSQGSLVVIMGLMVFFPGLDKAWYPLAAMLGGLAVGMFLLSLVGVNRGGGMAILLMGIAVESTLSSITLMLLLHAPAQISHQLGIWLNGSLYYSNWSAVQDFLPWCVLVGLAMVIFGRPLSLLELGAARAQSLGSRVNWVRPLVLLLAVLISAATVTAVGPIAFLGILAPALANAIAPARGFLRLAQAALMGALLLLLADTLTRSWIDLGYMPVGLTIIIIGAPLFMALMRLQSQRG